jgi:hypothetical protein
MPPACRWSSSVVSAAPVTPKLPETVSKNVVGLLLAQMSNSDYRDFPGMRDFLKRTNCFVVKRVHPFAAIAIFRRSDFFKDVDDGEARR